MILLISKVLPEICPLYGSVGSLGKKENLNWYVESMLFAILTWISGIVRGVSHVKKSNGRRRLNFIVGFTVFPYLTADFFWR
jgi:hypothetical protein